VASRLDSILAYHRARAAADTRDTRRLLDRAGRCPDPPSLLDALVRPDGQPLRVIAEVKRRSPSAGPLAEQLDPAELAGAYARGGAAAVSVLTDEPHFGGSPDDVAAVRSATALPVLRKDFTVCANDVADARLMGASGVLLIVAALTKPELRELLEVAELCGLTPLVEVHDEGEQLLALDLGALLVGVNQRDLATFVVDPTRAASLAARFPSDVVTVAESGIGDPEAAAACAALGYDAVLVGEALVRAADPATALEALRAPAGEGAAA
jgi:indole-3-glycerol phosphate synthase